MGGTKNEAQRRAANVSLLWIDEMEAGTTTRSRPRTAPARALLLAALLCVPPVVPIASSISPPPVGGFEAGALAELERELARIVEASEVPGAAVALVARAGSLPGEGDWAAGFGSADLATGRPVTADTLFRTNSVSKSLVALALLRLHEEGRIDLEARLSDLAPEIGFQNPWEDSHPVRVVHLLEHTTGFDDLHLREYSFGPDDGSLRDALEVNPAPRTARWPPGTRMAYNNGGYAVAARLIEKITGDRFEAHVEHEILRPLGMDASGFGLERIDRSRLTVHHLSGGDVERTVPYPLLVRPAGGFIASARDLAALVRCLLRHGDPLIGAAAVRRMVRPHTTEAARAGLEVGYGLGTYTASAAGSVWHGHAGGTPSAYARYAYQPELGVGYVLLMNAADGEARQRLESELQRFLTSGRSRSSSEHRPPDQRAAAALRELSGFYRQSTSSWELSAGVETLFDVQRVRATEDGALALSAMIGGRSVRLRPAGGDLFRKESESSPSAAFVREGSGAVTGLRTWDPENLRAGNYDRTSAFRALAPPATLLLSLLLIGIGLLALPARGMTALLRRPPPSADRRNRWERALPLLALVSLVGAVAAVALGVSGDDGLLALGRPSAPAVAFFILTWAFALVSPAALLVVLHSLLRRPSPEWSTRLGRLHDGLVALACTILAIHLATWGVVGLRTWVY